MFLVKSARQYVIKNWWIVPLVIILLLAGYERLHNIAGYMTFLGDEGRDVLIVKRMLVDHKFTLLGPTASVGGFFLGPIYYYFMLPFLWLWRLNPVGPAIMVGLFGIATVYMVYLVGKKFFDSWTGLFAASLYALSPLVIAYSRSSWNPNVVPFFSILLIYNLWHMVTMHRDRDALWIGIILGIGIQLHYLFLFLFPLVGVWYFINRRRARLVKIILLSLVGFVLGVSPFLAFEVRHGFPNTISIIQFVLAGKDTGYVTSNFFSTLGNVVFRLFGRLIFRMPPQELWNNYSKLYVSMLIALTRTSIYVTLGALCYVVFNRLIIRVFALYKKSTIRVKEIHFVPEIHSAYVLLFLWFTIPLVLFGFYRKPIYDYYLGIIFPVPFLLIGIIFSQVAKIRLGKWIAGAACVGLLYFNWQGRPFVYPPNNQLAQIEHIAQVAVDKTDGKPFNFALIAAGNSDHAYRYFFEIWGRAPVTIEPVDSDPERKTVTDQLIVICEMMDCQPLGNSLWEVAGFGRAEIVGVWDAPFVKIYKLVHYAGGNK